MSLKDYDGTVAPAAIFKMIGSSVEGSKATSETIKYPYAIINENIKEFTLKVKSGSRSYAIKRESSNDRYYYDKKNMIYTLPSIDAKKLCAMIYSKNSKWSIDFKFSYRPFFYQLLKHMTSTDPNLYNVANPESNKTKREILNTLDYERVRTKTKKGKIKIKLKFDYQLVEDYYEGIPLQVIYEDDKGFDERRNNIPIVVLKFIFNFKDKYKDLMCRLIAMDYSSLVEKLKENNGRMDIYIKTYVNNIENYLLNYTTYSRGNRIRDVIFNSNKNKKAHKIAHEMRQDIDDWIITANHWAARREKWRGKEHHQNVLSDVFGSIQTSEATRPASPVNFLRMFRDKLNLKLWEYVALILQYGVGHCDEHGLVSYLLLWDIKDEKGSSVNSAIFCGQANVDHAFAMFNLDIKEVIVRDKKTKFFNLRKAVNDSKPKIGWVIDPYLDPSQIPFRAHSLLNALNSAKAKRKKKDTHFLMFFAKAPKDYEEITERKGQIKNA